MATSATSPLTPTCRASSAPAIVWQSSKTPMKKTRKQAAQELWALQKCYEVRPLALATVYQRIYRLSNGNWHLIGRAHDYTAEG